MGRIFDRVAIRAWTPIRSAWAAASWKDPAVSVGPTRNPENREADDPRPNGGGRVGSLGVRTRDEGWRQKVGIEIDLGVKQRAPARCAGQHAERIFPSSKSGCKAYNASLVLPRHPVLPILTHQKAMFKEVMASRCKKTLCSALISQFVLSTPPPKGEAPAPIF